MVSISIFNSHSIQSKRDKKGKSLIQFPSEYCVIDLETTGLSPLFDEIIEMSALKIQNGSIVDSFSSLVQPSFRNSDGDYIDSFIVDLTGITNEMLEHAPRLDSVLPLFLSFVGDSILVGHNVNFDVNFIYDSMDEPFSNDFIDTMRISRKVYPEFEHHRLDDMCDHYSLINTEKHRAASDCKVTFQLFECLQRDIIEKYGSLDSFSLKTSPHGVRAKYITTNNTTFDQSNPIYGKVIVFTGTLERMPRRDAMQIVADLGGINGDGVTKKTNYLVLGNNDYCKSIKDGKSNKQKKAEQYKRDGLDIEIIPEDVFYEMIAEEG